MKIGNNCFYFIILFIVLTSEHEINVCTTALRYQLLSLVFFIKRPALIAKRIDDQNIKDVIISNLNSQELSQFIDT
jgi:hypothetical protein